MKLTASFRNSANALLLGHRRTDEGISRRCSFYFIKKA